MDLNSLTAIGPLDGRYRNQLEELAPYCSEFGLIRYRVKVEVEYLIFLADSGVIELPTHITADALRAIYLQFSEADALRIKEVERTTNHDVKAVEYFLKEQPVLAGADAAAEWIHFGLTSQDVNNTAVPMLWRDMLNDVVLPTLNKVIDTLYGLAVEWRDVPMLARTHGQPASPTMLGKELMVFVERLRGQMRLFGNIPYSGKFGGATGNFNAHHVAFPGIDWEDFGNRFLSDRLGLERNAFTTQIEPYDNLAAQFDSLKRINNILIDLCRDIWQYVSMEYFKQRVKAGEVGSSAMPHKVNPIDFENAEGNLGIANALYEHLSAKLPISRLQRDLTDSTVLRNVGVPAGHSLLAFKSILKGLGKLVLNRGQLEHDLSQNPAVVAEALQTILRREGYPKPYEALKDLTRGKAGITAEAIRDFVAGLEVSETVKQELLTITPHNYTGVAFKY